MMATNNNSDAARRFSEPESLPDCEVNQDQALEEALNQRDLPETQAYTVPQAPTQASDLRVAPQMAVTVPRLGSVDPLVTQTSHPDTPTLMWCFPMLSNSTIQAVPSTPHANSAIQMGPPAAQFTTAAVPSIGPALTDTAPQGSSGNFYHSILERIQLLEGSATADHLILEVHDNHLRDLKQAQLQAALGSDPPLVKFDAVASDQEIDQLKCMIDRTTKNLETAQSEIGKLRRLSSQTEDDNINMKVAIEEKDAIIDRNNEIIDLVPELLDYFTKKKSKKRQTVQISAERIERVKELMQSRSNTEEDDDATSVIEGEELSVCKEEVELVDEEEDKLLDMEDNTVDGDVKFEPAPFIGRDKYGVAFQLNLFTIDTFELIASGDYLRDFQPNLKAIKLASTSDLPPFEVLLDQFREKARMDGLGIGEPAPDFVVKLERLDLKSVRGFDTYNEADGAEKVEAWKKKLMEMKMQGGLSSGLLKEMNVYAFTSGVYHEVMTVLLCQGA